MIGFTGVISSQIHLNSTYKKQFITTGFEVGFSSNTKFNDDKIFIETSEYIIGLDGVILNKKSLCKNLNWEDFFIQSFIKNPHYFLNELKGAFCGFVYHKQSQEIQIFNDPCAIKKLFYFSDDQHFIFSSSLLEISELLEQHQISYGLNVRAAYSLLSYGGLIENDSLIEGIYRVYAAEIVSYNTSKQLHQHRYYDYNDIEIKDESKQDIIDCLDEKFNAAIVLEYDKDLEYDYQHFTTLSGGLDSRMNVMLSAKHAYKNRTNLCFSQSGYLDEYIAKEISSDLNDQHIQIPLDSAEFIKQINENARICDYQSAYTGAAHLNYALNKIDDFSSYGIIHSGLLGDAILCGFTSDTKIHKPNIRSGLQSNMLFHKIENEIAHLAKHYKSEDSFQLYYRQFGITITGCYTAENRSYMISPFMEKDFMSYSLSIHPKHRFKSKIYIDWINNKHIAFTKYIWEKTKTRPTPFHVNYTSYLYRIERKIKSMLGNKTSNSMNPYQYWFDTKSHLYEFYENFYQQHISYVDRNRELQKDISKMYYSDSIINKILAVSLLNAIKQLKIKL